MQPLNILLFPSGSLVAKEIYDSLLYEKSIVCYGTDATVNNVSSYYMENYIPGCPFINDVDATIEFLQNCISKYNIKYIYPAFDSVITFLKAHENKLGCIVIAPDIDTIRVCDSKLLTYNLLKDHIPCPTLYKTDDSLISYPVYVKPISGYGSRGHSILNTLTELKTVNTNTHLLCEHLTGDEFTVDCFTNSDRKLLYACARRRSKTLNGMSIQSETVDIPAAHIYAEKINNNVNMRGAWFFQIKYDKHGTLKLLEIACRIPGAMCVSRGRGINFPLLTIHDYENRIVDPIQFNDIEVNCHKIYRNYYKTSLTYNHVYVDLDDTLIIKGRVNIMLIAFLYQCLNSHKMLYLITRNSDPERVLNDHKIHIFDKIYKLPRDHSYKKSSHIEYSDSIFIDDSYIERTCVSANCNIPCFSPSDIECLLSYF